MHIVILSHACCCKNMLVGFHDHLQKSEEADKYNWRTDLCCDYCAPWCLSVSSDTQSERDSVLKDPVQVWLWFLFFFSSQLCREMTAQETPAVNNENSSIARKMLFRSSSTHPVRTRTFVHWFKTVRESWSDGIWLMFQPGVCYRLSVFISFQVTKQKRLNPIWGTRASELKCGESFAKKKKSSTFVLENIHLCVKISKIKLNIRNKTKKTFCLTLALK